jgi:hypothetical protein
MVRIRRPHPRGYRQENHSEVNFLFTCAIDFQTFTISYQRPRVRHYGISPAAMDKDHWKNVYMSVRSLGIYHPTFLCGQEGMVYPLLFTPGTGWEYGVGIDWAGQIVT